LFRIIYRIINTPNRLGSVLYSTNSIFIMYKFLTLLFLALFSTTTLISQSVEEEIEFKYIKAKYLLDTERYEDAIKSFTALIKEDEDYSDALVLRAEAKYAMAAYKGTKKDVLRYAELKGVTPRSITLLGMADYKMGNMDAALNSFSTAIYFENTEPKVFVYLGEIYREKEQDNESCYFLRKAAKMGSSKGAILLKKYCNDVVSVDPSEKTKPTPGKLDTNTLPSENADEKDKSSDSEDSMKNNNRDNDDDTDVSIDELNGKLNSKVLKDKAEEAEKKDDDDEPVFEDVEEVEEDKMPVEDNTPNEIEIDEDLTLVIRGQGLGKRRILDQPNILILADEDGVVAVDICVNKRGKVESAEFNTKLSTIAKKSLVSLAIRKAKDFWFEKNDYKEQCGVIMFKIKGS